MTSNFLEGIVRGIKTYIERDKNDVTMLIVHLYKPSDYFLKEKNIIGISVTLIYRENEIFPESEYELGKFYIADDRNYTIFQTFINSLIKEFGEPEIEESLEYKEEYVFYLE